MFLKERWNVKEDVCCGIEPEQWDAGVAWGSGLCQGKGWVRVGFCESKVCMRVRAGSGSHMPMCRLSDRLSQQQWSQQWSRTQTHTSLLLKHGKHHWDSPWSYFSEKLVPCAFCSQSMLWACVSFPSPPYHGIFGMGETPVETARRRNHVNVFIVFLLIWF